MIKHTVTVGCDPEFFLFDTKLCRYISAHDKVPGNKQQPHKLRYGAVQADGTAVEFNINPAKTSKQFVNNINRTLKTIRNRIPKRYEFAYTPSIVFDEKYFDALVPDKAKEFGCDPDYNAYAYDHTIPNQKPKVKEYPSLRTGAGHIHVGFTNVDNPLSKDHMFDCKVLVENLDRYFSYFAQFWDKDERRRNLYGKSGDFRPKKYGLEYRTLSNAWLNYPELWPWIFESVQFVVDLTLKGEMIHSSKNYNNKMIMFTEKKNGYHKIDPAGNIIYYKIEETKWGKNAPKFPMKAEFPDAPPDPMDGYDDEFDDDF